MAGGGGGYSWRDEMWILSPSNPAGAHQHTLILENKTKKKTRQRNPNETNLNTPPAQLFPIHHNRYFFLYSNDNAKRSRRGDVETSLVEFPVYTLRRPFGDLEENGSFMSGA